MNGCPQSVFDGFKVIVQQLESLQKWFAECPLGREAEGQPVPPLATALHWFEAGMQGISDWSDAQEEAVGVDREEVREMIREADYISTDDYDPDYWVTDDQLSETMDDLDLEQLTEKVDETFDAVADLKIEQAKVVRIPERAQLIELLVEALQGLATPVATDVSYGESKAEVDQVPEVHGPLLKDPLIDPLRFTEDN